MKFYKKFVTIFPGYEDFHFYKDPGQIPFRFAKLGYCSEIWCYGRGTNYNETKKNITLKLFDKSKRARIIPVLIYLVMNAKKIDVLNIFHIQWDSLLFAFIYKLMNRKGCTYLKMDNCVQYGIYPWENYLNLEKKCSQNSLIPFFSVKQKIKNFLSTSVFFDYVDLWSIEDDESRAYYSKQYKFFRNKLITVYNGHTVDLEMPRHIKSLNEKDDIILTVGRLGTYQKATEILLEAYSVVAANSDFNLHLAGQIENKFQQEVYEYFNKYPNLQDRVVFHGPLEKDPLFELYNRSKIFCLPSRYETFALVFGEAMFFKNAIVTTHNVSPSCIVKDQMGLLVEKDDPIGLANAILDLIRHPEKLEQYSESAHLFAVNELNWDKIVVKLNDEIDGKLSHNQ